VIISPFILLNHTAVLTYFFVISSILRDMATVEVLLNIHIAATLHLSLTRFDNFIQMRCHVQASQACDIV
jgi:hypothetical protein